MKPFRPAPTGFALRPPAIRRRRSFAFTLVELLIVIAIIGTISAILVVYLLPMIGESKEAKAVQDIKSLERQIQAFLVDNGHYPDSLADIVDPVPQDPWGNPYQYTRIDGGKAPRGKWRKDRFLVPLNSDYDLFSMGPDGKSTSPLTAKNSRDDIVRAGNGGFIGSADDY